MSTNTSSRQPRRRPGLSGLIELIQRLRSPDGCPWDREQDAKDVRAYLLEEAHEVADAIDRECWRDLRSELGDLLFQICFLSELAAEKDHFELADIVDGIHHKMVERHPHVFGSEPRLETSAEVARAWQSRKLQRDEKAATSILDGVPNTLPALAAALRLGQKAAGVGFDWEDATGVLDKLAEELHELRSAMDSGSGSSLRVAEELGDVLFTLASLGRHLGVDPEHALALANLKFKRRFSALEARLGERLARETGFGPPTEELRRKMEEAWEATKEAEVPDRS